MRLADRSFRSRPMLLAMAQYFASNFTFFISLTWMHPYLMSPYHLSRDTAAWYSMLVLLIGATAQWVSASWSIAWTNRHYRRLSRRIPAMIGFVLADGSLDSFIRLMTTAPSRA